MEESEFVEKYIDPISKKLDKIISYLEIKEIVQANLADFSKEEKAKTPYSKPMPKMVAGWTIGKKGCNRCGGDITWDNYNKETHPFPDHINTQGQIIDCPEYKPKD